MFVNLSKYTECMMSNGTCANATIHLTTTTTTIQHNTTQQATLIANVHTSSAASRICLLLLLATADTMTGWLLHSPLSVFQCKLNKTHIHTYIHCAPHRIHSLHCVCVIFVTDAKVASASLPSPRCLCTACMQH